MTWWGGGVGYPGAVRSAGAEILVWRDGGWQSLGGDAGADADTPGTVAAAVDADVGSYLLGGDALHLVFAPMAENGTGGGADVAGRVVTDFVEVRVRYRLP